MHLELHLDVFLPSTTATNCSMIWHFTLRIKYTSRVPVEGKSSVCLICMKYRIIILIIIIICLGQILLSYIENTSRTYARTHAHTRARTYTHTRAHTHTPPSLSGYCCAMGRWRPTMTARSGFPRFCCAFFAYKKIARPN